LEAGIDEENILIFEATYKKEKYEKKG